MTRLLAGLGIILIVLSAFSCSSRKGLQSWSRISMERTPCFGTCPIYTFTLHSTGIAEFNGKRFTEKLGNWTRDFSESELEDLRTFLLEFDPQEFDSLYSTNYSDLPGWVLEFQTERSVKRIEIYGEHPALLDTFIEKLTSLVESEGWQNQNTE